MNALKRTFSLVAVPASFAVAALTGCNWQAPTDAEEEEIATASVASAIQSTENAASANGLSEGVKTAVETGACVTPEGVAAAWAAQPPVGVYPSTCLTKTAKGSDVHVEYDDCTGPFGTVHVFGGAEVLLSAGETCDSVDAVMFDSGDLTANHVPLEYEATATVRIAGNTADMDWTAAWSATTWAGEATADDDLAIQQDLSTYCVTATGTGHASVARWDFTSELEGFAVCPDACPSAGRLVVSGTNGKWSGSISIDFDGSEKARVIGTQGQEFEIDLVCGE